MSAVLAHAFSFETSRVFGLATPVQSLWAEDITCMIAMLGMTGIVYFLQHHIIEYAYNMIDRQKLAATLFYQNIELERQLKEYLLVLYKT